MIRYVNLLHIFLFLSRSQVNIYQKGYNLFSFILKHTRKGIICKKNQSDNGVSITISYECKVREIKVFSYVSFCYAIIQIAHPTNQ